MHYRNRATLHFLFVVALCAFRTTIGCAVEPTTPQEPLSDQAIALSWKETAALFDGARALDHIANQIAFGPRTPERPHAKQKTLDYISSHLSNMSYIQLHHFQVKGLSGTNIWARISGTSQEDAPHLLLGAHWDTRSHADREPVKAYQRTAVLGANDGASGVAVLLEVAEQLAQYPAHAVVDLLFFDLEDMGNIDGFHYAMGSQAFVDAHPDYRPDAGVIVDMVCDKNLRISKESYSMNQAPKVMSRIWQSAKRQRADAFTESPGMAVIDDHLPFLNAGIAVVDLIHLPFPKTWHTLNDRIEHCSAKSLSQVGRVVLDFIYHYVPLNQQSKPVTTQP